MLLSYPCHNIAGEDYIITSLGSGADVIIYVVIVVVIIVLSYWLASFSVLYIIYTTLYVLIFVYRRSQHGTRDV